MLRGGDELAQRLKLHGLRANDSCRAMRWREKIQIPIIHNSSFNLPTLFSFYYSVFSGGFGISFLIETNTCPLETAYATRVYIFVISVYIKCINLDAMYVLFTSLCKCSNLRRPLKAWTWCLSQIKLVFNTLVRVFLLVVFTLAQTKWNNAKKNIIYINKFNKPSAPWAIICEQRFQFKLVPTK